MWSRTTKEAPTSSRPQSSSTTSPPPTFLANHHRTSSSTFIPAQSDQKGKSKPSSSKRKDEPEDTFGHEDLAEDDDAWAEGSDDEAAFAALVAGQQKLGTGRTAAEGTKGQPVLSISPPVPLASPSSWSFNPFSIIAPSPKTPTDPPLHPVSSAGTVNGPEAVAAVLAGSAVRVVAPVSARGGDGAPAGFGKAAGEGVEEKLAKEPEVVEDPVEVELRRARSRMEQCQAAIKPDVDALVKDPISLLSRLTLPSTTPAPLSPLPTFDPRASISPSDALADAEDSDDDPAAGYVQLNALNLSSGGPEIVEFGKEEEAEEDRGEKGRAKRRRQKFIDCLGAENVDLAELRTLAWAGIPEELRPMAWQLLLGYLPAPSARRLPTLARKRQEYADAVRLAFGRGVKSLDGPIWHQITIDVPRTNAGIRLWQCKATQKSLERILYVWAIRHPASGYVQGINDLVTPFFQVFLSSYITTDPEEYDVSALPPSVLEALEADSFWCLSKLLDGIQDNYIFAQPGIQRQVARMKELCSRVDAPLAHHLEEHNVEFIQFAFRWINCLLMREMSVKNIVRMWDTYLAEGSDAFSEFHLYVCLAFLVKWSDQLRGMDFQAIIMFLQSLPTQDWEDKNTELLLSEAFMWSRTFEAR